MSAMEFVLAARSLVGAAWKHRGRKKHAVDCIGVLALASAGCGRHFEDERGYGREPWEDRLRQGLMRRYGEPFPASEAIVGDIPLFRFRTDEPSHVGIIGDHPDGGLSLIHANPIHGVIEQRLDARLMRCVVEVYRP